MQSERWQFGDLEEGPGALFPGGADRRAARCSADAGAGSRAMLDYCGLAPGDVLGVESIRRKQFPAEKVAISAVMAGCLPEYFPVVAAAVSAVCDRAYNFHASSTSTNGIANLVMVSGPYASRIGMNHGVNLMGNGNRANASIGRAINLLKAQLLRFGGPGDGQERPWTPRQIQLLPVRGPGDESLAVPGRAQGVQL